MVTAKHTSDAARAAQAQAQQAQRQQQQQERYVKDKTLEDIMAKLKEIQKAQKETQMAMSDKFQSFMEEAQQINEELRILAHQVADMNALFTELEDRSKAVGIIRKGIKNPRQLNMLFMDGMTIGELLQKHIKKEDYASVAEQMEIPVPEFNKLLEDKLLPDKHLTDKLTYILNKNYDIKYPDFMVCKAHTYTKMERFSDMEKMKDKVKAMQAQAETSSKQGVPKN